METSLIYNWPKLGPKIFLWLHGSYSHIEYNYREAILYLDYWLYNSPFTFSKILETSRVGGSIGSKLSIVYVSIIFCFPLCLPNINPPDVFWCTIGTQLILLCQIYSTLVHGSMLADFLGIFPFLVSSLACSTFGGISLYIYLEFDIDDFSITICEQVSKKLIPNIS